MRGVVCGIHFDWANGRLMLIQPDGTRIVRQLPPPERWEPGAPAHVMPLVVESDLATYAAAGCCQCKRRGLVTRAERFGLRYRIVGRCKHCGQDNVF
jgi:hypothetical protein